MDFAEDNLELRRLAGGNIIKHAPIFSVDDSFLFIRCNNIIRVYATNTGEQIRQLLGARTELLSMEFELAEPDILVACTTDGEVLRWRWRTGILQSTQMLKLRRDEPIKTFNLMNYYRDSETACAFITQKPKANEFIWNIVDTTNGNCLQVPSKMILKIRTPIVEVGTKNFKYVVIAQGHYIYFLNYKTWQHTRFKSANMVPFTVVRMSPVEEMVATGDERGRIFLWRHFNGLKTMKNTLHHWHHTAVTSIAFTPMGTEFYSSGLEAVLVKWNVGRNKRSFLPRMNSIIRHVAISTGDNTRVLVCTEDNGVQFIGAGDNSLKSTMQEFTFANSDKTGTNNFPLGLRLNPRTNTLVLNGRNGCLQFYSAYTKNLLYNLNIVNQNQLSHEMDNILYNIRVTKAAFNIDWMATGEVFNDQEHLPELRLKFWKYNEGQQSYALNSVIELPHEGGFKAIAFSNDYQVDNLLCATVGEDKIIKMWGLEDSEDIYKPGKVWTCISQTSYKQMPIESISFSEDGSIFAAGFGNTLCIYKADTMKLKAALTGSAGYDGALAKAQLLIAKYAVNGTKNDYAEQRKKLWQLFRNLLESNDDKLIYEIQNSLKISETQNKLTRKEAQQLDDKQKSLIYMKIRRMDELNLFQKLQLLQKFQIRCTVHEKWQTKMINYLHETNIVQDVRKRAKLLDSKLHCLNLRERYKAKYRLQHYRCRKGINETDITKNLLPILNVLNLGETTTSRKSHSSAGTTAEPKVKKNLPPMQTLAEIRHVQFAAGEFAHLVVVCTDTRLLIWNLLTLRLKSVLKLSVEHLSFDAQTNLIAAVTKNNELHVFQPNVPLPIYQRANLPKLYGMIWLPRLHPKQSSINVDWQAQSTLYFLTEDQDLKFLTKPDDNGVFEDTTNVAFSKPAEMESVRFTTFGTYATKQHSDKKTKTSHQNGPLIIGKGGKTAVSELVALSTHTMPPLNLICGDFIKSFVSAAETAAEFDKNDTLSTSKQRLTNGHTSNDDEDVQMNGHAAHADSDVEAEYNEADNVIEKCKTIIAKTKELHNKPEHEKQPNMEKQLQRIAALHLDDIDY